MLFDPEVWQIIALSLQVSAIGTGASLLIGLPFGAPGLRSAISADVL
jgi:ABC-type tungstate transport system substrate-binding protein